MPSNPFRDGISVEIGLPPMNGNPFRDVILHFAMAYGIQYFIPKGILGGWGFLLFSTDMSSLKGF